MKALLLLVLSLSNILLSCLISMKQFTRVSVFSLQLSLLAVFP